MGRRRSRIAARVREIRLARVAFVLPNLFTLSSVFCGLLSILWSSAATDDSSFARASIAVFFAMFFDMVDGRVARLTRTQSDFGIQLDSLADVVSFGVAPAVLAYRFSLDQLAWGSLDLGLALAFVYVACGTIRLARFNLMAQSKRGRPGYFVGLPIPLAAGALVSVVLAHHQTGLPVLAGPLTVAATVALLSALMVSSVPYRSFKNVHFSRKATLVVALAAAIALLVGAKTKPALAFLAFFTGYILFGLAEGALLRGRDRREARRAAAAAVSSSSRTQPGP